VVGDSKCSGSGSAPFGVGFLCGFEELIDGIWIGALSGGFTGIIISSVSVTIPLENDKTRKRNEKLLKIKHLNQY